MPIIGHVQTASVPKRNEPGTGELDDARIFRHLDALGYDGYVGCEYRPAGKTLDGLTWMKGKPLEIRHRAACVDGRQEDCRNAGRTYHSPCRARPAPDAGRPEAGNFFSSRALRGRCGTDRWPSLYRYRCLWKASALPVRGRRGTSCPPRALWRVPHGETSRARAQRCRPRAHDQRDACGGYQWPEHLRSAWRRRTRGSHQPDRSGCVAQGCRSGQSLGEDQPQPQFHRTFCSWTSR